MTDIKGDALRCCVVEYPDVMNSTEFVDRDNDTSALNAIESASELVQRTFSMMEL
ncbi:hypothetical protein Plhal304r1_c005g0020711 [Plasmopara halstedii]